MAFHVTTRWAGGGQSPDDLLLDGRRQAIFESDLCFPAPAVVPDQRNQTEHPSRAGARTALRVEEVTRRSVLAQQSFAGADERVVDALLRDIALAVAEQAPQLADAAVRETGLGNVADKELKIRFASVRVQESLRGRPAAGVVRRDRRHRVLEVATPVGVVLGLMPVTNPVATLVFKVLIALKGRNALIASPHHRAQVVSERVTALVRGVLDLHGVPLDLVQCLDRTWDRDDVGDLMRTAAVRLVLATGGAGLVKAAYSSGTPAIGVGPGNAPAYVAADAAVEHAARDIVASKSFDNGIICGSEQHLIVDELVGLRMRCALQSAGAAVLTAEEVALVQHRLFDDSTGRLRRALVGQSATVLAAAAGVPVPSDCRLIVAPLPDAAVSAPWQGERLAPLIPLRTVPDPDAALGLCRDLLRIEGAGHTAVIHTRSRQLVRRWATVLPASRLIVNGPSSQGCVGLDNGLVPSFTLGCGTHGRTSTSDNVSYQHLLNLVRVAEPLATRHPRFVRAGDPWSLRR